MPTLSISGPGSLAEGTGGNTAFTFTVARTGDLSAASLVDYWLWPMSGGGPGEANQLDFEGPTTGTIYFNSGEATRPLLVTVRGDSALEPNETFNASLSNPRGADIGAGTAQATILNDDGGASTTLSWGNPGGVHKAEGNQTSNNPPTEFVYVLNRGGDVSGATTADWTIIAGEAVDKNDFASLPFGQVSFAAGETSKNIVLRVNGDLAMEPDEAFRLVVSNVVGATTPPENSGTIINDDGGATGPTSVSIVGPGSKAEGTGGGSTIFSFNITRSGDLSGSSIVDYWTWPMTGRSGEPIDQDFFQPTTGSVYFQPGTAQAGVNIFVAADTLVEPNETFNVSLSNPRGAVIANGTAQTVIVDDDGSSPPTSLSWGTPAGGVQKNEGDSGVTDYTFVLNRTGDVSGTTTADYGVFSVTVDAADFAAPPSGHLTFAPGEMSKAIVIQVAGDTLVERDEGFRLDVTSVVGATAPPPTSGLIINDDGGASGPVTVSISGSIERAEGNSGLTPWDYLVTRSGDLSGETLVDYFVIGDVTGPHESATPDYQNGTGTLYFRAGEAEKTIRLQIVGDTTPEPDESFILGISNPRGATIGTAQAHGRILDDDGWVMA